MRVFQAAQRAPQVDDVLQRRQRHPVGPEHRCFSPPLFEDDKVLSLACVCVSRLVFLQINNVQEWLNAFEQYMGDKVRLLPCFAVHFVWQMDLLREQLASGAQSCEEVGRLA